MSLTDLAPAPTRQQLAAQGRTLPGKVTGRLKVALDAMVWRGLPRAQAAAEAGLSEHALYKALRKPPVKAHYLHECEVLRTSGRARRIHRLEAMVEQNENKAAVINAALALDRIDNEHQQRLNSTFSSSPGLVIVVNGGNVSASHVLPNAAVTERDRQQAIDATDD